jgi:hypothetical protein
MRLLFFKRPVPPCLKGDRAACLQGAAPAGRRPGAGLAPRGFLAGVKGLPSGVKGLSGSPDNAVFQSSGASPEPPWSLPMVSSGSPAGLLGGGSGQGRKALFPQAACKAA